MDFLTMDINTLKTGVNAEGVKYLELFLTKYVSVFGETVNPGCGKCLQDYLTKYQKKMSEKNPNPNNSGYKLHEKYEGIPLEFGSQVFVNNSNLTDEYAKVLLSHEDGERFFAKLPEGVTAGESKKAKAEKPKTDKPKGNSRKKAEPAKAPEAPAKPEVKEPATEATKGTTAGETKE